MRGILPPSSPILRPAQASTRGSKTGIGQASKHARVLDLLHWLKGDSVADFDLAIIGGGINGTGIARDAAGRGLRVVLVEQNDLASGTSSASSKLIHGGLRYLEHGDFCLVHEALREREVLLRAAPHLIRPLRFRAATGAFALRLDRLAQDPSRHPRARSCYRRSGPASQNAISPRL